MGDVLAQALSAVAKERPADPVQFVADFLLGKHDEVVKKQQEGGAPAATTTSAATGERLNGTIGLSLNARKFCIIRIFLDGRR